MNTFYKDGEDWLGWTDDNGVISVHVEIASWSLSSYKKYIKILVDFLKTVDAKCVYTIAKTDKAKKFNELFGFNQAGLTEEGWYVMELQNVWIS